MIKILTSYIIVIKFYNIAITLSKMEKGRANTALEQITATMRGATTQRGEMTSLKANTEHESVELARRKVIIVSSLVRYYLSMEIQ